MISRIVLGTVQLGLPYGRRRWLAPMPEGSAFEVLDAAWALGIRAFDTAEAYGASAERVRKWSRSRGNAEALEVVTKVAVQTPGLTLGELEKDANAALTRFEGTSRLSILSHGAAGRAQWPAVASAARRHRAIAGQSVYTAEEVRAAADLEEVKRVQAPGNILDRRALDARGASAAQLDIRSVFLQGILLDDPLQADQRAPGSGDIVRRIQSVAQSLGADLAPLLLAAMLSTLREGDRLVIGVDSVAELSPIPASFAVSSALLSRFKESIAPFAARAEAAGFLDPRAWTPQIVH